MSKPTLLRITKELDILKQQKRKRTLGPVPSDNLVNLRSNSYLHLEANNTIQQRAQELLTTYCGNGASRLVQSSSPLFEKLEILLAQWKGTETSLLFNSGYATNTGILQAIARKGTEVFCDRLNHASIIDGIKLSGAKLIRYNHCDADDLQKRISQSSAVEKIIVSDSIFSMDGNIAPLEKIAEIGQEFDAITMIDEAHSTGLFGEKGSGLIEKFCLQKEIDITVGTLSKAVCGTGGFFAGSNILKEYLLNSARPFIFSTALAESNLAWNIAAVECIQKMSTQIQDFFSKIDYFTQELRNRGINCGQTESAIVPIITGSDEKALALSRHLQEYGFSAAAIRPPTVPPGTSRVRLSLHMGIGSAELNTLLAAIGEFHHG